MMNNNLVNIPYAIQLAQKTKGIIYQNIVLAFSASAIMIFLLFFLCPAPLQAGEPKLYVRHPEFVQVGDPFLLQISGSGTQKNLRVTWLEKSIPLKNLESQAELLLPVPLSAQGELPLRVHSAKGHLVYSAEIKVRQKKFASQNLTVEPRFVTPPEAEKARIARERDIVRKIYATFTPHRYFSLPLQRPVPGAISSEFGLHRLFNSEPRSRHMGLDFRGAEGSEVRAIAAGRVVLAADHYFPGLMVIVDHGQGVHSTYMHLSAFKTEVGQFLNPGDLIGLVGKTGRVTGPHLHLDFVVQGERQTPEPFMPDLR